MRLLHPSDDYCSGRKTTTSQPINVCLSSVLSAIEGETQGILPADRCLKHGSMFALMSPVTSRPAWPSSHSACCLCRPQPQSSSTTPRSGSTTAAWVTCRRWMAPAASSPARTSAKAIPPLCWMPIPTRLHRRFWYQLAGWQLFRRCLVRRSGRDSRRLDHQYGNRHRLQLQSRQRFQSAPRSGLITASSCGWTAASCSAQPRRVVPISTSTTLMSPPWRRVYTRYRFSEPITVAPRTMPFPLTPSLSQYLSPAASCSRRFRWQAFV